jgi:hypothetical protein
MPTNKTPLRRGQRRRVRNDAAETFKAALALRPHREAALVDPNFCPGIDACATCIEYEDHVERLRLCLSLTANQTSPIDVVDLDAPPELVAEDWDDARILYVDLCEASGVEPATKLSVHELSSPHRNIRWVERNARIPDGPKVGQRARLREWQRHNIRKIYGNGDVGETVVRDQYAPAINVDGWPA